MSKKSDKKNKSKLAAASQNSEEEKNPLHKEFGLFSNLKYLLAAMWKYSKVLIYLIPLGFLIAPAQRYLWSFLSKFIIDIITRHGSVEELFKVTGICSVAILLLYFAQTIYYNKLWVQCIVVRMRLIVKRNWLSMTMPFESTEDPDVLDCSRKSENAVQGNNQGVEGMEHQIIAFAENLGVVITGLVILGTMNPLISLATILLSLVNFFISNKANKYSKKNIWDPLAPWWRKRWYMDWALGNFEYAKDIRMYGLRTWLTDKFTELNKTRYAAQQKNNRLWFWVGIFNNFLWMIFQTAIYAYLIWCVFQKQMTIGNFTLYLAASGTFFGYVSSLLNSVTQLLQRSREVDDFRSFMEMEGLQPAGGVKLQPQEHYEFEFQNVSFKYPRGEKYALKDLNLTLKAGERLAVVGLNGAGKSTFIKLLLRLYEPTEGKILLNGVDISTYEINSYYEIFAPVFQDVRLFAFTLAENVSMKAPEETDREAVTECLKNAGLDDKLASLEKGLDTQILKVIYDDGIDLSGGQKQKLALARALYKNSPVVILDEPTAALDAVAESKLYSDFDRLIGGKTAVYISHRLSSTQFCNNVAMFKDGHMIEYGTHKSLMAKKGEYANMFQIQSHYYTEDESIIQEYAASEAEHV